METNIHAGCPGAGLKITVFVKDGERSGGIVKFHFTTDGWSFHHLSIKDT